MPEAAVRHVNGWPVIREYLRRRGLTQTLLAEELGMTPSAVTQMKQGKFLLNAGELRRTADFLHMDVPGRTAFYRQIFFGRLVQPDDRNTGSMELRWHEQAPDGLPECSPELLEQYEPLVENLSSFLMRHGTACGETVRVRPPLCGLSAPGGVLLQCNRFPGPGDAVLLKCRHAPCRFCTLHAILAQGICIAEPCAPQDQRFIPFAETLWMRPVLREVPEK